MPSKKSFSTEDKDIPCTIARVVGLPCTMLEEHDGRYPEAIVVAAPPEDPVARTDRGVLVNRSGIDVWETPAPELPNAFLKVQTGVEVEQPPSISCTRSEENGEESPAAVTIIRKRWNHDSPCLVHPFVFPFALVWNGVVWSAIFVWWSPPPYLIYLHAWVGILLIWFNVMYVVNSTVITITGFEVMVETKPIRSFCCLCWCCFDDLDFTEMDKTTVEEVRCKRQVKEDFEEQGATHQVKSENISYQVEIVRVDGDVEVVVDSLSKMEEALFIAQEMERVMSRTQA